MTSSDGLVPRRGFLYEILLEVVNPPAYRAYVRSKLLFEADNLAAKAKAILVSKSFLRTIDQVSNQFMKGDVNDED